MDDEESRQKKLSLFFAEYSSEDENSLEWVERMGRKLPSPTLSSMIDYIQSDDCQKIVVLVGAGVSTSAGIPDFKSPDTGVDHNLHDYDVEDTEDLFTMNIFRQKQKGFYKFARFFTREDLKPSTGHMFLKLLHDKGLLKRIYTQNMDNLEEEVGIPVRKIVQPNGNYNSAVCLKKCCHKIYGKKETWKKIQDSDKSIPRCDLCKSLLKPNVVFVGESFPPEFYSLSEKDLHDCDLLLVMGTSLTNYPFASLLELLPFDIPRLVINRVKYPPPSEIESIMGIVNKGNAWRFDSADNYRDVVLEGEVDEMCFELADFLGWKNDLLSIKEKIK